SHLFTFDYASGYYFYLWAEVLDKDAFAAFTQSGDIFNTNIAQRFRREILERGGSEDGMTMYHKFRGDKPSRMPLLMSRGLAEPPKPDIQYHY
ncbi:MAG: M3 family metallopeptidase, partial [Rikenellaceae bacterium]